MVSRREDSDEGVSIAPGVSVLPEALEEHPQPRVVRASFAALGFVAAFGLVVGLRVGGESFVAYFDDISTALAAALSCAMSLRAARRRSGQIRRFWLTMAAACGAWAGAEVIWAVYELGLHEAVPVPSWADVGYLGAIPLAVAALVAHPGLRALRRHGVWAVLDGVLLATALLFLSWTFVLGPLWRHGGLSSAGGLVAIAYPFGDVVLLFLAVFAIRAIGVADRLPLWCVLGGLAAMALSDSLYSYLQETAGYANGNLVDTGWVVAYLGFALGAYAAGTTVVTVEAHGVARRTPSSIVLPLVPVPIALAVIGAKEWLGHRVDRTGWWIALVLTVLVLGRQALLLLDRATGAARRLPGAPPALGGVELGGTTAAPAGAPKR